MRRFRDRIKRDDAPTLDVTTFMNLMVVLIPFLLISAVFSRVTILELSVPTSAGGPSVNTPNFAVEVVVRQTRLELATGSSLDATIQNKDGEYDLSTLRERLLRLKAMYPDKEDATVLMEPDIAYDHLIQVMDAVRGDVRRPEGAEAVQTVMLFPNISIGDAP